MNNREISERSEMLLSEIQTVCGELHETPASPLVLGAAIDAVTALRRFRDACERHLPSEPVGSRNSL